MPVLATRDTLIEDALASGRIAVDTETGHVYNAAGERIDKHQRSGYRRVPLNNRTNGLAHRVVWIAAHGAPADASLQINHRNGDRGDNRLVNLELVTQRENLHHRIGGWAYKGVREADIAGVDPEWLARALELAASGQATEELVRQLADRRVDTTASPYDTGRCARLSRALV